MDTGELWVVTYTDVEESPTQEYLMLLKGPAGIAVCCNNATKGSTY